jgi:hypothetical protein
MTAETLFGKRLIGSHSGLSGTGLVGASAAGAIIYRREPRIPWATAGLATTGEDLHQYLVRTERGTAELRGQPPGSFCEADFTP